MPNFRRQSSLTDAIQFTVIKGKEASALFDKGKGVHMLGIASLDSKNPKMALPSSALQGDLAKALDLATGLMGFQPGRKKPCLVAAQNLWLFMGLGSPKEFSPKSLLNLGGKLAQQIQGLKVSSFVLHVDSFFYDAKSQRTKEAICDFAGRPLLPRALDRGAAVENLLTGLLLGLYKNPSSEASSKKEKEERNIDIQFYSKILEEREIKGAQNRALSKARATFWVRDEASLPPNELTPETFSRDVQEFLKTKSVSVKVFDEVRLQKEGFGGIWSVGKGSVNPPRLVQASYNGGGKKSLHVVLIGKGVTFDTGGISLKQPPSMHEMKHDMTGAAVAAAAFGAAVWEGLKIKLTVLLPMVENRPSHNSLLPGDVYEAWGGSAVEVQNTDAEGRLLLADCLAYAKALQPSLVVDLATLTGAASVTLGPAAFLLYGNKSDWIDRMKQAVNSSGEQCWEMPLFEEYAEDLRSNVAHIRNHVGHREGNSHVAAAFLNYFVDAKYPWLHLDICSYSLSNKWKGAHCPSESASGLPTLAMIEFLRMIAG